jgi:hypothetical protein
VREYRRYTYLVATSFFIFYAAVIVFDMAVLGLSAKNGIMFVVNLSLAVFYAVQRHRDVVRLSPVQIFCGQPHGSPSTVRIADLAEVRWENPKAICFATQTGPTFVLSLSGMRKSTREEIRRWLQEHLSTYCGPPSNPSLQRTRSASSQALRAQSSSARR